MPSPDSYDRIPTPVAPHPLPSFEYADLEKGERIGRGGDADVYYATVTHDGTTYPVAVKEPRFEGTIPVATIEQYLSEAETWTSLDDHDNIVSVYDWGDQPLPWLALEYMDGGTLADQSGSHTVGEALWLAGRVAEGIRHGHRHGVTHLDIKPTNILLAKTDGELWDYPKVSDWGLAQRLLDDTEDVAGLSPTYAAPEQFDPDEFGQPDDLTDIYQLGTVIYELCTGSPPFTGSHTAVMQSVLTDEPVAPSERNPDIPEELDEVVLKALSKRKADRYEAIVILRQRLDEIFEAYVGTAAFESVVGDPDGTTSPDHTAPTGTTRNSEQMGSQTHGTASEATTDRTLPQIPRRAALGVIATGTLGTGVFAFAQRSDIADSTSDDDTNDQPTGTPEDGAAAGTQTQSSTPEVTPFGSDWSGYRYDTRHAAAPTDISTPTSEPTADLELAIPGKIAVRDKILYAVSDERAVAHRLDTDTRLWEYTPSNRFDVEPPTVTDEYVLLSEYNGPVVAVEREAGTAGWEFTEFQSDVESTPYVSSPISVRDGAAYFADSGAGVGEYRFYAVDVASGSIQWTVESDRSDLAPAVGEDIVVLRDNSLQTHAYGRTIGENLWQRDDGYPGIAPVLASGSVLVTGEDLRAFDIQSGETLWSTTVNSQTMPAVADGQVYLTTETSYLLSVGIDSGEVTWEYRLPESGNAPVVANGTVYTVADNTLYGVNTDGGTERFTTTLSGEVITQLIAVDGYLLYANDDGTVVGLSDSDIE